jgi:predicted PurR-regulated permease PerM
LIGVLSAAIGKTLGVAGTFIAPIIVLLLMSFGKMAINAWCEMRKEQSNSSLSKIE